MVENTSIAIILPNQTCLIQLVVLNCASDMHTEVFFVLSLEEYALFVDRSCLSLVVGLVHQACLIGISGAHRRHISNVEAYLNSRFGSLVV